MTLRARWVTLRARWVTLKQALATAEEQQSSTSREVERLRAVLAEVLRAGEGGTLAVPSNALHSKPWGSPRVNTGAHHHPPATTTFHEAAAAAASARSAAAVPGLVPTQSEEATAGE